MRGAAFLSAAAALAFAAAPDGATASAVTSCTGYVDALPTTISTPGRWCLRQNLRIDAPPGRAIDVAAADVTLDCDGFTVRASNSKAGDAVGIGGAAPRTVVRDCVVHGFPYGIAMGGPGAVVEVNTIRQSWRIGIRVTGDGSELRGNHVHIVGGYYSPNDFAEGIRTLGRADVIGNFVKEVRGGQNALGRYAGVGISIVDNRGGLVADNLVQAVSGNRAPVGGIRIVRGAGVVVRDNALVSTGRGIGCEDASPIVSGNSIVDYVVTGPDDCVPTAGPEAPGFRVAVRPPPPAETCTGYIDSLPAVVSGDGRWCLRGELRTNIDSGNAIVIEGSFSTLDCRGHAINGASVSGGTQAVAVYTQGAYVDIRNCDIRGFHTAAVATSSSGSIENNRITGARRTGIQASRNPIVRGNRIRGMAGAAVYGIRGGWLVAGNEVDDLVGHTYAYGLWGGDVTTGNRVRAVDSRDPSYERYEVGIQGSGNEGFITGNLVAGSHRAIVCSATFGHEAVGNVVDVPTEGCPATAETVLP